GLSAVEERHLVPARERLFDRRAAEELRPAEDEEPQAPEVSAETSGTGSRFGRNSAERGHAGIHQCPRPRSFTNDGTRSARRTGVAGEGMAGARPIANSLTS